MELKVIKIPDHFYGKDITLFVGNGVELSAYMKKKYNVTDDLRKSANGHYFAIDKDDKVKYFLSIDTFSWLIGEQSLLAHEILHLVFAVSKDVGLTYCMESEESFTYYFQHIMGQVWFKLKSLNPYNRNAKKKKEAKRKRNSRNN